MPRHWDLILLYDDVMKVADTGFHPKGCHPSSPFGVIPVLDTGIQEF
ncbi:hypothetical protein [Wolbachia endosymbiont (group A) of Agelastica alni]